MDEQSQRRLARMIRRTRVAALGTLRDETPLVAMVIYSCANDFSEFYIHASRLAQHTRDMLDNPRVSLMIAEPDENVDDPLTLARISIRGTAEAIAVSDQSYESAKTIHLQRFPFSAQNFLLGDFSLYRIQPDSARYVAGFGRIFNVTRAHLVAASTALSDA